MMISQELIAAIRRFFYVEHWKVGTIASELNLHPDTVKRALETERFRSCQSKSLPTDPFLDFIEQTLKQHPRLRATRLFEMLRDRGYQGDIFQLRRAVRKLRPISREAFLRLSVLPGEQAQVDWASFGELSVGRARRRLSCFVLTLSYSRAFYFEFFFDQSLERFLRGHINAFTDLGGVPRAVLYGLRVLLGDPPIDWNKVQSREEFLSVVRQRDSHYAKVVEDEILAKGRKALLIAGSGHFARQSVSPEDHVGRLIEKRHPKSLFVIISHGGFLEQNEELEPRLVSWPKPSLAILKGTRLGALDASLVMRVVTSRDGGKCIYNPYGETLLEVAADAYLYLGPSDSLTNSPPAPDIFKDEVYVKELKRRFKIMGSDFDPAPHIEYLMSESSKKFDTALPIKPQKKCP